MMKIRCSALPLWMCFATATLFASACAETVAKHECTDGIDNDDDGLFDGNDPGCKALGEFESPDPVIPACSDGIDNDGDGKTDLEDDGCFDLVDLDEHSDPVANCRDGIDNDGDGWTDWPADPGCGVNLEDSEADDCPDGPHCPACANGKDDDGDGFADFPEDIGCDSASDRDEFNADPSICGASVRVLPLEGTGEVTGSFLSTSSNDIISAGCGGAGPETVYQFTIDKPKAIRATTNFPETDADTVLYLRGDCRDPASEIACNDDGPDGIGASTLMIDRIEAGEYFLVADSFRPGKNAAYRMLFEIFVAAGEECDPAGEPCAPGFVCRKKTADAPVATCEPPECRDGMDNDGDGKTDYPDEPGCDNTEDNDETDDCPAGPNCPACGNASDDDHDGKTDFPEDAGCTAASDGSEIDLCLAGELEPTVLGFGVTSAQTTFGDQSQFRITCEEFGGGGPEHVYSLVIDRELVSLRLSTEGSSLDTIIGVRKGECDAETAEVGCADIQSRGETLTLEAPEFGTYYVFIDSDFGTGNYDLSVTGVIAGGKECDANEPAIVCEPGFFCNPGTSVCEISACNNGGDDDGDGQADWPNDPGCEDISDNDEVDDCPDGPNCPACSNTEDDDGDGFTDFGDDIGCSSAGDNTEKDCDQDTDDVLPLTQGTIDSTTSGKNDDGFGSCGGTFGPEEVFTLRVPGKLENLHLDSLGSDLNTILYVRGPNSCEGEELGCNDQGENAPFGDSILDIADVEPGVYFVFVDGGFGQDYTLHTLGTIAPGQACDSDQIASGLMECSLGHVCKDGTCQTSACNSQADEDGDGLTDFPDDPGCESLSDDDEADDCPDGPNCPACANNVDDDGDGQTDFPDDPGCEFPADNLELDPCAPGTPILELTDAGDSGTTPAADSTGNFQGTCNSAQSPEVVYAYEQNRDLTSLTFSTEGSTGDTILYVRKGECSDQASEVGCAQQFGGGENLVIDAPETGTYYVFVDGNFNGSLGYELSVSGVIGEGGACDPASEQFVCSAGTLCDGATCVPTACNNGADDDGDGKTDAEDPGCSDIEDNDEAPDPSPLPACADGIDNDNDGQTDFPDDPGCARASDGSEVNCQPEMDPLEIFDAQGKTGDTSVNTSNDFAPSCVFGGTAADRVYEIVFPGALESLTVDTFGSTFDTVLSVLQDSCTGTELGCNDQAGGTNQSEIALDAANTPLPAGLYVLIVDGWSSSQGPYTLNVNAVIAPGEACDQAQVNAGIAACSAGETCQAGVCAP